MNIGRLDRKITIEQQTRATNSIGEYTSTWSTYHTAFANVQRGTGNEKVEAEQVTATSKVKFKIRFFDGIDESMRISYNNNYYDITDIQELGREGLLISANKKL